MAFPLNPSYTLEKVAFILREKCFELFKTQLKKTITIFDTIITKIFQQKAPNMTIRKAITK